MMRSILRNTSRLASRSAARCTSIPFVALNLHEVTKNSAAAAFNNPARHFSSGNGKASLNDLLVDEVSHEMLEEDGEVDQEFEDSVAQIESEWQLTEKAGEGVIKLTKSYNNETIDVVWDVQDEADMDDDFSGMDENGNIALGEEGDDADPDGTLNYGINVEVLIHKGATTLMFDCVASQDLEIMNIRVFPEGKTVDIDAHEHKIYGGPKIIELEEKVQEAFHDYLAERGVHADLAYYVLAKSRDKEQKEYVNWMNQIVAFNSK